MSWGSRHTIWKGSSDGTVWARVRRMLGKPAPKTWELIEVNLSSDRPGRVIRTFDTFEEAQATLDMIRGLRLEASKREDLSPAIKKRAAATVHAIRRRRDK